MNDPRNIMTHWRRMTIETILAMTERSQAKRQELEAKSDQELNQIYAALMEL